MIPNLILFSIFLLSIGEIYNVCIVETIVSSEVKKYEIKNSKFLVFFFFVRDRKEAKEYIQIHNKEYSDVTHNCYAYILDDDTHYFSDNGEPTGTAGKPMLNSLVNNGLNYTLVIVTRYYGGIMLGGGGLIRAYGGSVSKAIREIGPTQISKGFEIEIIFTHKQEKNIDYIIKKSGTKKTNQEFDLFITFILEVKSQDVIDELKPYCSNLKIINFNLLIVN